MGVRYLRLGAAHHPGLARSIGVSVMVGVHLDRRRMEGARLLRGGALGGSRPDRLRRLRASGAGRELRPHGRKLQTTQKPQERR